MKKILMLLSILWILSCDKDAVNLDECSCYHHTTNYEDYTLTSEVYIYEDYRAYLYYNGNGVLTTEDTILFHTNDFCTSVYSFGIGVDTTFGIDSVFQTSTKEVICD